MQLTGYGARWVLGAVAEARGPLYSAWFPSHFAVHLKLEENGIECKLWLEISCGFFFFMNKKFKGEKNDSEVFGLKRL